MEASVGKYAKYRVQGLVAAEEIMPKKRVLKWIGMADTPLVRGPKGEIAERSHRHMHAAYDFVPTR